MSEAIVHPRRPWTDEDAVKFAEFVKKEGYDSFRLRVERMICEQNEELIAKRNMDCIPKIEILTTLLRVCDAARD